jgi:hypothetical protein
LVQLDFGQKLIGSGWYVAQNIGCVDFLTVLAEPRQQQIDPPY